VLSLSNADAVPADSPLKELGLDSLMAVEVRNALGKRAGAILPATLVFNYPTPAAITDYLLEKVLKLEAFATNNALKDLERLEAFVATEQLTEKLRSTLLARITPLVSRLTGLTANQSGIGETVESISERLDAANDDELFALLDRQLELTGGKNAPP
jgi:acyl carrier protein